MFLPFCCAFELFINLKLSFFVASFVLFTAKSTTSAITFSVFMFVMMMEMLVVHVFFNFLNFLVLFDNSRLMNFLVDCLLLLYDGWLVMVMNAFHMSMGVFMILLFNWYMNDDFLFLDVTAANQIKAQILYDTDGKYAFDSYPPSANPIKIISTTSKPDSS